MAGRAGAAGLDGMGDVGDGAQVEFLDFAPDVRFAHREAFADDASLLGVMGFQLDPQFFEVHAAPLRPVEHRRFQRLGAHDRAMHLLARQAVEVVDDVLVANLERAQRGEAALFDQRAERLGGRNGRRAAERQVACFGDDVLCRITGMPPDAKGEAQRVAADDRAVFAQTVRVFDLPQVGSRLAVHRVHEKLFGFLAIFPSHVRSPYGCTMPQIGGLTSRDQIKIRVRGGRRFRDRFFRANSV